MDAPGAKGDRHQVLRGGDRECSRGGRRRGQGTGRAGEHHEAINAGPPGFEPGLTDPESVGLPLPHGPVGDLRKCCDLPEHSAPSPDNSISPTNSGSHNMSADTTEIVPEAGIAGPSVGSLLPSFRLHLQAENKAPRTI